MSLDVTVRYEEEREDVRRVRGVVEWRDLVGLSWWEKGCELALSLPWLGASLFCYQRGWVWAGAVGSFFFFLTGLRQSHNAQHYALGLPRRVQDGVLAVLSVLMMGSMHAVQTTHLHHHRHCLDGEDIEAGHANERWWRVLLMGPVFPVRLHVAGLRLAGAGKRGWIVGEMVRMGIIAMGVFGCPAAGCLRWHVGAMVAGECFSGLFAVWSVHHGCDERTVARTQRGWWKNFVSYSMFYHLEHHLFPAVPTSHLPELARRLDRVTGEGRRRQVI